MDKLRSFQKVTLNRSVEETMSSFSWCYIRTAELNIFLWGVKNNDKKYIEFQVITLSVSYLLHFQFFFEIILIPTLL